VAAGMAMVAGMAAEAATTKTGKPDHQAYGCSHSM